MYDTGYTPPELLLIGLFLPQQCQVHHWLLWPCPGKSSAVPRSPWYPVVAPRSSSYPVVAPPSSTRVTLGDQQRLVMQRRHPSTASTGTATCHYLRPAGELVENSAASTVGSHLKYFSLRDRYASLMSCSLPKVSEVFDVNNNWLAQPVNFALASHRASSAEYRSQT